MRRGDDVRRDSPPIERASGADLAMLAMDTGRVPQHLGAVLRFDPGAGLDLARVQRQIAERISAVPRLRQRLVRVPPGCGRAIWVDDARFDVGRHVRQIRCPEPGDEQALHDLAVAVITEPLPRRRPLWSAVLVTGLAGDAAALVISVHHVLADGIGGLALLAGLVDGAVPVSTPFPRRPPSYGQLARDAALDRLAALRRAPAAWWSLRTAMAAGGGLAPARAVSCSLVHRTGPHRRLAVVRADLAGLRAAAHRYGGTVNDAVLTAVAGALHRVLRARGESVGELTIAVPVAGRRTVSAARLGNQVSPLLVRASGTGDPAQRITDVAAVVRAGKTAATGPAPIAVLGPVFRAAAALGGYDCYMNHQHRLHTLVSHVRGPDARVAFAGAPVGAIIPMAVGGGGNITVYFEVLSYAGTVTIAAIVDPDHFPDVSALIDGLRAELALLTAAAADARYAGGPS